MRPRKEFEASLKRLGVNWPPRLIDAAWKRFKELSDERTRRGEPR